MPLVWQNPEEFMRYAGVTVYHCYKNDQLDNRMKYHFTTDVQGVEGFDAHAFDIRELPGYVHTGSKAGDRVVVANAIKQGAIRKNPKCYGS